MSLITLEEAKLYLRVDITDDDTLISSLLQSAITINISVARLSSDQWEVVDDLEITESDLFEDFTLDDARQLLKMSILYTLSNLYEHRTDADHGELNRTLRSMLFPLREAIV